MIFFGYLWLWLAFVVKTSENTSVFLSHSFSSFELAINFELFNLSLILYAKLRKIILNKNFGQLLFDNWVFVEIIEAKIELILWLQCLIFFRSLI